MSPKSKHNEKTPEKQSGKERKASSRHGSISGTVSANAYNPLSGTFHAVAPEPGVPSHTGRFKTIDDGEDNSSSVGASAEYDSISNTGSWSGESEDQTQAVSKEKQSGSPGTGPGSEKRDKIRWKNEKKHQRQKERRAKDLKDRATGYLMSRKLEILSEQLVSMGFPSDRATMSLIMNEGHVERSVAWLLEGGDEQVKEGWKNDGGLKIDISEELARIAELEIRYKYPRIEVERAIVACQGDVDRAAEWLRDHHPIGLESDAHSEKGNATQEGSTASTQELEHTSAGTICGQLQEELHRTSGVQIVSRHKGGEKEVGVNSSRSPAHVSSPLRNEARVGTGSVSRNTARAGPERLKPTPKSLGRVPNSKLQTPMPVSHVATRSILSSVSLPTNYRTSFQIKNLGEIKQFEPKTSNLSSQQTFLSQQPSQISANSACHEGGGVPHPSIMEPSDSPPSDKHNNVISSSFLTVAAVEDPLGAVVKAGASAKSSVSENCRSNAEPETFRAFHYTASQASEGSNKNLATLFSSEQLLAPVSLDPSSVYSSKPVHNSPEILAGWAYGAPGGYVDWNMAAVATCDYRTIDWSMPPSPSNSSETGFWGLNKGLPATLNVQEGSRQRQGISKDLGLHLQNSKLCSSLSRDLGNSYDIWDCSKLRGSLKPLGSQENDSGHSSLEEWTSPFAGKDLFTLSHQAVSFPYL